MNPAQVRDILGGPDLAWLVARLRWRMERDRPLTGSLFLDAPTEAQRDAVGRLFGRYPRTEKLGVSLDALNRLLVEAGAAEGLAAAVEAMTGPISRRAALEEAHRRAWEAAFDQRHAQSEAAVAWWTDVRDSGLARRLCGDDPAVGARLLASAAALSHILPTQDLLLTELAASLTGDAHALDPGAPLGTLALRLIVCITGVPFENRRRAWASVGVSLDVLSSSVLALNLPASGSGIAAALLRICGETGEPCRLTLRQIRARGLHIPTPDLWICENPSVLAAAADRLGRRCPPMLCVEGHPGAAVHALLDHLEGARIHYHGDLDWGGLRIANGMLGRPGALPWRMSAADYVAAPKGGLLLGRAVEASWDAELTQKMVEIGRAAHEEAVLDLLLADLGRRP